MDVTERSVYQFISNDKIFFRTAIRTNNSIRYPHPKAKLLNIIWNLNLIPIEILLSRPKFQTCDRLTNLGINMMLILLFAEQMKKIFIAFSIRLALPKLFGQIYTYCPSLTNSDFPFIDWLKQLSYNKIW